MKFGRSVKWLFVTLVLAVATFAVAYFLDTSRYDQWRLVTRGQDSLPWSRFEWQGDSSGSRYLDRAALFVSMRISGVDRIFKFQLDLGSQLSMLYGTTLNALDEPTLRVGKLKSPIYFWDHHVSVRDITLDAGSFSLRNSDMYIMPEHGTTQVEDTIYIGTLGSDAFHDKILLIDYPHERWCVLDTLSETMQADYSFGPMELDEAGRPLLPIVLAGQTFNALFDTGSSYFPVIAPSDLTVSLSGRVTDTVHTFAWGKSVTLIGQELEQPIIVAGRQLSGQHIYHRIDVEGGELILGNALFWDHAMALDFKHGRFGLSRL